MKISKLMLCVGMLSLSGCLLTSNQDKRSVSGKQYTVDETGAVLMTEEDLESVLDNPNVKYVPQQRSGGGVMLTQAEYQLAMKDTRALYTMLGMSTEDEVVSLVLPGSLKNNMQRLINEQKWESFELEGPDMYIEEPYVVKGDTLESVLVQVVANYPVYLCVNNINKAVAMVHEPEKVEFEVFESIPDSIQLVSVPAGK